MSDAPRIISATVAATVRARQSGAPKATGVSCSNKLNDDPKIMAYSIERLAAGTWDYFIDWPGLLILCSHLAHRKP
jgi:hypothetical protein